MGRKSVLLLTYGNIDHASSRIRGVNHFNRLKNEFDITWIPRVGIHHQKNAVDRLIFIIQKAFLLLKKYFCILFFKYDIVFVQILFLPEWMLKILKRKGSIICYDFDDAVYTYSRSDFDRMINYADKVVIASPFLEDSFDTKNKDFAVIYSPVDTDMIKPANDKHDVFTIGWIGSPWTGPYLADLKSVFQKLSKTIPFKLLVVGAQIEMEDVNVACLVWSPENELQALSKMDVGIMPLPNNDWAKMKGGYKLYLYMAAGKPIVASPWGINATIVKNETNGFLADTDDEWINAFLKLYGNNKLSRNSGKNSRVDAEQNFSYKVCTSKLYEFLK